MGKRANRQDNVAPDFFDPPVRSIAPNPDILQYLRELTATWQDFVPPEEHAKDSALGVLVMARGIQITDGPPPRIRLTVSGERWQKMLVDRAHGDRTEGAVLNFVWLALRDAEARTSGSADPRSAREDETKTGTAPSGPAANTKRIYAGPTCPTCGAQKVKYLKASEFAEKSGIPLRTVQDRMGKGAYCQDRFGKLPWCATCKAKTPEGDGTRQPPDGDHASDRDLRAKPYTPTLEEVEQYRAWGGDRAVCERAMNQSGTLGRPLTRDEFDELTKQLPSDPTCNLTEEDEDAIRATVRRMCKPDKQEDAAQDLRLAWLKALPRWDPEKASRATFRTRVLGDALRMEWRKAARQKRANHATVADRNIELDDGGQTSLIENLSTKAHKFRQKLSPGTAED